MTFSTGDIYTIYTNAKRRLGDITNRIFIITQIFHISRIFKGERGKRGRKGDKGEAGLTGPPGKIKSSFLL